MTKLTEDIIKSVVACEFATKVNGEFCFQPENVAKAAAEVCKGYIERAFDAGGDRATFHGRPSIDDAMTKEEWLKSEGITE